MSMKYKASTTHDDDGQTFEANGSTVWWILSTPPLENNIISSV